MSGCNHPVFTCWTRYWGSNMSGCNHPVFTCWTRYWGSSRPGCSRPCCPTRRWSAAAVGRPWWSARPAPSRQSGSRSATDSSTRDVSAAETSPRRSAAHSKHTVSVYLLPTCLPLHGSRFTTLVTYGFGRVEERIWNYIKLWILMCQTLRRCNPIWESITFIELVTALSNNQYVKFLNWSHSFIYKILFDSYTMSLVTLNTIMQH